MSTRPNYVSLYHGTYLYIYVCLFNFGHFVLNRESSPGQWTRKSLSASRPIAQNQIRINDATNLYFIIRIAIITHVCGASVILSLLLSLLLLLLLLLSLY
jgi:hypothetical protein